VVSPAPASQIEEPTTPGVEELGMSLLAGTGAALLTVGLLSLGPFAALSIPVKLLLTGSAFAGSAVLARGALEDGRKKTLKLQVSPAPSSQVKCPTILMVEET